MAPLHGGRVRIQDNTLKIGIKILHRPNFFLGVLMGGRSNRLGRHKLQLLWEWKLRCGRWQSPCSEIYFTAIEEGLLRNGRGHEDGGANESQEHRDIGAKQMT